MPKVRRQRHQALSSRPQRRIALPDSRLKGINPMIVRYRCCTCGGTGLVPDDLLPNAKRDIAEVCRDCDGTGIDPELTPDM